MCVRSLQRAGDASLLHRCKPQERSLQCRAAPTQQLLDAGRSLAETRAQHTCLPSEERLFEDPYAAKLAQQEDGAPAGRGGPAGEGQAADCIATRFVDDAVLSALSIVNMDLRQDYRQAVLLGCGMDTRPFRLPWPEGSLLFELAAPSVHEEMARLMQPLKARVPRGSLLRRVALHLPDGHNLEVLLKRAGFRADRLSIWAMQGFVQMGLSVADLRSLLAAVAEEAAQHSLVVGELPPMPHAQAMNLLAEAGLLGRLESVAAFGKRVHSSFAAALQEAEPSQPQRWLFTAQVMNFSSAELDILQRHTQAALDTDEDWNQDNFS